MPRKTTDPYEVLGLSRGATEADVRAAYLRLAKKHHPDKNPGDKASEWIFKEVQRAYETLRDASDARTAGQERPPRAQEDHARTRRERQPPPAGDRAERDQRERAERARQREQQQAQSGSVPTCHCVVRWWTRLPLIVRLIGAWVRWALGVVGGAFGLGLFMSLGVSALAWLLSLLGLPLPPDGVAEALYLVLFVLAFGLMLWSVERPQVCPQCGCVSSGLS